MLNVSGLASHEPGLGQQKAAMGLQYGSRPDTSGAEASAYTSRSSERRLTRLH
jgi:hypothetical protein